MTHFLTILTELRSDPLARRWFYRIAVGLPVMGLVWLVMWMMGVE